jgi:hypothetical protein
MHAMLMAVVINLAGAMLTGTAAAKAYNWFDLRDSDQTLIHRFGEVLGGFPATFSG